MKCTVGGIVGSDKKTKPRFCSVLLPDPSEGIGAGVGDLISKKPILEVGHLNDNRLCGHSLVSGSVNRVLIGTADKPLLLADVGR